MLNAHDPFLSSIRFNLDKLGESDIPDVVRLSENLGWDYGEREIRLVLEAGLLFGHRSLDGRIVSTSAVFPYGGELASLGLVMVDPAWRRRGLASEAVRRCLKETSGVPVTLVATSEGKPLYEKLGFLVVDTLHKLVAERYQTPVLHDENAIAISRITNEDIPGILRLDREAFGADRGTFLQLRIRQAAYSSVIREPSGRIAGYALGVKTPERLVIGPVVARDWRQAAVLIDAVARRHPGKMRIDIPSRHQELIRLLETKGFRLANIPPVMLLGGTELSSRKRLFAVAAQAYG